MVQLPIPTLHISLLAHVFSGLFMFIALVFVLMNYSKLRSNVYMFAILLLLLAITMTLHGLSHLGLEVVYGYDPLSFAMKSAQ
jgi:disulfide bond formation protein DsbB